MQSFITRRRLLLAPPMLALAGCVVLGGPERVTLSQERLQDLMRRRFPLDRRLLDVLDVTLSDPRVTLLPERNRIAATFELTVGDRLFGSRWNGALGLDSALRWSADDHSLRLQDVRIDEFRLDPAGRPSAQRASPGERIAALLGERVLEDYPIYELPAERREAWQRAGRLPEAVRVTGGGVEVTFRSASR